MMIPKNDGTVDTYEVSQIDSMRFTGSSAQTRRLQLFNKGAIQYIPISQIDGIYFRNSYTGLYMGIIGFNETLSEKSIGILNNNTKSQFQSFINALTMKLNTGLYYAVDNAINRLQAATLPDGLDNVSIITFTDGLDNASTMLNTNYLGKNKEIYRDDVKNRILTTKIKNLNISAYSVGIRGSDVQDGAYPEFQANLPALASKASNVYEVSNMTEVNNVFKDIATSLYNESHSQSIKMKIPGGYNNGTKMRFTFDNVTHATYSNLYIEGDYMNNGTSFSLQNIVYKGLKSSSGTKVQGVREGLVNVAFTFEKVSAETGYSIGINNTKHWYVASSQWNINSEFGKDGGDVSVIVERKSAAIMLVLDCTTSLGATNFSTMKSAANDFISVLLSGNTQGGNPGGDPGGVSGPLPAAVSTKTWTVEAANQVWSDYIAYGENKTTFVAYKVYDIVGDYRNNPGYRGYVYNFPYVVEHQAKLCPSPWRVPSPRDIIDMDLGLGNPGYNVSYWGKTGSKKDVNASEYVAKYVEMGFEFSGRFNPGTNIFEYRPTNGYMLTNAPATEESVQGNSYWGDKPSHFCITQDALEFGGEGLNFCVFLQNEANSALTKAFGLPVRCVKDGE